MEISTEIKNGVGVNTSNEILREFCKVRNLHSSYKPSEFEITPRMDFIIQTLSEMGLNYKVDVFNENVVYNTYLIDTEKLYLLENKNPIRNFLERWIFQNENLKLDLDNVINMNNSAKAIGYPSIDIEALKENLIPDRKESFGFYGNIVVEFKAKVETDKTIMFTAHHDVCNVKTDNCADNSASVCNLLRFAYELKDKELDKNVYVAFTDGEEFGGKGAKRLSIKINNGEYGDVEYIVNSELSSRGKNFWAEKQFRGSPLLTKIRNFQKIEGSTFKEYGVPFNDSIIFRRFNIDSVCIGIVTDSDIEEIESKGSCKTWGLCHRFEDSFSLSVEEDMNEYVEMLHNFL